MSSPDGPPVPHPQAPDLAALLAQACGLLTAGIGVSALIGWIAGITALHSVSTAFIPTAPSTALTFAFLGAAAFALDRWPDRRAARTYVNAAAILVCAFTALVIAQFVGGFDLGLEPALSTATTTFQGARVGRMSPLAAGGLLPAALALIALTSYPAETVAGRRAAAGLVFGTLAIGLSSLAGYALGAPFLYNSVVVPVALPTAGGLSLLGAGILSTALRASRPGAVAGTEARPQRRARVMRYVPAALGAGATALLTLVAAGIARQLDQTRLQGEFDARARTVAVALRSVVEQGLTNVRSAAAAIAIDEDLTRVEFRFFAAASHPLQGGAVAVAWVPRVPLRARAGFESAARRDGSPGYQVTERGPAGRLRPAGRRDAYFPVLYVEPSVGLQALVGFDAATDPAAADAMVRARDADTTAVSGGLILVADPPGHVTVVTAQPLFHAPPPRSGASARGALRGYALGIVRLATLVRAADPGLEAQGIALTLRDVGRGAPAPLYGRPDATPAHPFLAHAETLAVADRRWEAAFVPLPAYASRHPGWNAWALLAAGLLFAFLIAAHLFGMEGYASDLESAHETLHTSEARFRAISETAADGIITINAEGTIVHCNAAAARAFGYEDGRLFGRNVRDLVPAIHVLAHTAGLEGYRATGEAPIAGETLELPALRRDGSEFPIDLSLATWETREGRFATAIVRDITERKNSQDERERLIAQLQDALANIKTLSGLLPVCSWCHKVLDDRGAWRQMEAYVHEHTDADFSHGVCPDCEKKYLSGEG